MTPGDNIPFAQAMKQIAAKMALGTNLSSAEIAATWTKEARALSLYSARNTCAECMEDFRAPLLDYINGKTNEATCRFEMQKILQRFGYDPEKGFPDHAGEVPPAVKGSLTDLASDKRVRLVTETIARLTANTAYMQSGQDADALYDYPAWELVRVYLREHPRGSTDKDSDLGWPERWVRAGGTLIGDDNRMIARKDDPIWENLGDSGVFPDGTDSDAPPYAFNSGMGIVEVERQDCLDLGMDVDDLAPRQISLLGDLFEDPSKATLGDLKAKRGEILDALKELEEAA